jgi:hypothetical protein
MAAIIACRQTVFCFGEAEIVVVQLISLAARIGFPDPPRFLEIRNTLFYQLLVILHGSSFGRCRRTSWDFCFLRLLQQLLGIRLGYEALRNQ